MDMTNIAAAQATIERLLTQNPDLDPSLIAAYLSIAEQMDVEFKADLAREYRTYYALLEAQAATKQSTDDADFIVSLTIPVGEHD